MSCFHVDLTRYNLSKNLYDFQNRTRSTSTNNDSFIRKVIFSCLDVRYYIHEEQEMFLLLKAITDYGNNRNNQDTLTIEEIEICKANDPELVRVILLHFIRHSHIILTFDLHECDISAFFQPVFDDNYINESDDKNNHYLTVPLNHTIRLEYPIIFDDDDDQNNERSKDLIRTEIQSCKNFVSWHFNSSYYFDDIVFILNALGCNKYIESIHFEGCDNIQESLISSITNMVTHTTSLIEFEMDCFDVLSVPTNVISDLSEALIQSETITDLSIQHISFETIESLQQFRSIFEKKKNIQKLIIDSSIFAIDDDQYKFNVSVFAKILQNNNNHLRELHVELPLGYNSQESVQQILFFFELLKDTCIEYLSIRFHLDDQVEDYLYNQLFINTLPYMKKLRFFQVRTNYTTMSTDVKNTFVKSIATCNRFLVEVETFVQHWLYSVNSEDIRVKKYLERNQEITTCINTTTNFPKNVFPRILSVTKHTGPDATFHLLCSLGMSVGPVNMAMTNTGKATTNTTHATTTTIRLSATTGMHLKRKCTSP